VTAPYYQDDLVTLYHGDCLQVTEWLSADVLVTDPPYGIAYTSGTQSNAIVPTVAEIDGDNDLRARDAALMLWDGKPALVFGSWRQRRPSGVRHRLIWHKTKALPGFRMAPWYSAEEEIYVLGTGFTGVPEQNVIATHERRDGASGLVRTLGHPTPKPVGLLCHLVQRSPEGVIADPFAGSGSTLVAAKQLGRRCIGVEIEERYCEIAARRLAQDVLNFGETA
jgi:site-specific DNA-methyltransferase (adenine-specific)